jgi:hypothetical protein
MKWIAWALQILVALAIGMAGVMKLTTPRTELIANGMAWASDFSDGQVQLIGAAEALGAAGLILPAATGIMPILTPLAGVGLTLIMAGAVVTHVQRGESFLPPLILGLLAALAAFFSYRNIRRT